jgi:hypothetical protein
VSVNRARTRSGNDYSGFSVISANGRFVAFESVASDLVENNNDTNGNSDVFVRDLKTGATTLVSVNSAGTGTGNHESLVWDISVDGRFVAFQSDASDLVANDTNGSMSDVFVRDLKTGTTILVSVNRAGTASGNFSSRQPAMSADGRFVAFASFASDLVANDTNGTENIFVRDLRTGTTALVSVNSTGTDTGDMSSFNPAISADGRFVAFESDASDLVANDTNGTADAFVRDRKTGTTTLVSVNSAGTGSGNRESFVWDISADGRFVAFTSFASDLVTNDTNDTGDVFVRDLKTGTTTLASVNRAGTGSGNEESLDLAISANGRFVTFVSLASDLVANDTNGGFDVFVHDLKTGTTTLVSVNGAGAGSGFSFNPVISADGRFVAFTSPVGDLVGNDTNGTFDVFVRDLKTRTTTLVSVNSAGTDGGNGLSGSPAISADGSCVAFTSSASDLVPNDTNGTLDIFARRAGK